MSPAARTSAAWPGFVRRKRAFTRASSSENVSSLVSSVRGLVHGEVVGSDVLWVLVWAVALVAVLGPLTMRRYRTRN